MLRNHNALRILIASLAVYRLAQMVARDDGPMFIFDTFRRSTGQWAAPTSGNATWDDFRLSLAMLVRCPFCLGVWFSALLLPLVAHPSWLGDTILTWLGVAGLQSVFQGKK